MLLSVIIPAYNCEKTITHAIESTGVFNSKDIEVIVVNNGSTDNTERVVKELTQKNNNILYTESIKGVSNARNKGIELAKAEWITFLDADDVLLNEKIKQILLKNGEGDLLILNYFVNNSKINLFSMTTDKINKNTIISEMLENPTKYLTVWAKFYKAKLIKENNLKFDPSLVYSEDSEFLIRYLLVSKNIKFIDEFVYNYYLSENSTVRKYNPQMIQEYEKAIRQIEHNLLPYPEFNYSLAIFILMQFNLMMVHSVFVSPVNKLKELRRVSNKKYIRRALNVINFKNMATPRLIPLVFCKYHLYLLATLIYKIRVVQNSNNVSK